MEIVAVKSRKGVFKIRPMNLWDRIKVKLGFTKNIWNLTEMECTIGVDPAAIKKRDE